MASVKVMSDPDQVVGTMGAFRRRILAALDTPDSATGIARKLGTTRQKVNYHVRALESAGLVEVEEERPRRGVTERVMRRTADVVLVDPTAFDTTGLTKSDVVGLSGVVSTSVDIIRQAAAVSLDASRESKRIAAGSLDTTVRVATPSHLRSLLDEMATLIARYDSDEGLKVRLATTVLPEVEDS